MASTLIPVLFHITQDYYTEKGHFWERFMSAKRLYGGHTEDVLIIISYRFYKPAITRKQIEHFAEVKRTFPHVVVVHAKGVQWDGHDAELKGMEIPVFEEGHNAGI